MQGAGGTQTPVTPASPGWDEPSLQSTEPWPEWDRCCHTASSGERAPASPAYSPGLQLHLGVTLERNTEPVPRHGEASAPLHQLQQRRSWSLPSLLHWSRATAWPLEAGGSHWEKPGSSPSPPSQTPCRSPPGEPGCVLMLSPCYMDLALASSLPGSAGENPFPGAPLGNEGIAFPNSCG